jgi:uncharacterized membrane-anchored protein
MKQLAAIRRETRALLPAVEFEQGHRYSDLLPGKDRAAAYGITGLMVGATAARAGFLKGLWVALLAFKKFLVVGLAALGTALERLFTRKREDPSSTEQAT